MFPATRFTKLLGVEYPILLAPMAGASTAELTAAVSKAGGLGAFAAAVLSTEAIHAGIARVRGLTDKPFSVNLFILAHTNPEPQQVARAGTACAHPRRAGTSARRASGEIRGRQPGAV